MSSNLERRKSVMARSMKLGHCVCNPRNPCPCETFKRYNVCPCAGEKMPVKTGPIPLTRCVRKAGCASKIGQAELQQLLSALPQTTSPDVLVGTAARDDAGVYRIRDGLYLVQTVDVFTPCVDDPDLFGRIAAANSLSDVYAMGGRPLTALSIVGFPIDELDGMILESILRGGIEKLEEAGCSLIGGHSIQDEEIKCGFAVTGVIEGAEPVVRAGARPGDALVLTKPLGSGMISFAAQIGRAAAEGLAAVGESMATLNKDAAELMSRFGAHACTDVTGFGLAGHLVEMVRGSGVDAEIDLSAVPVFAAAVECIENDILAGAIERNQAYAMGWVEVTDEEIRGKGLAGRTALNLSSPIGWTDQSDPTDRTDWRGAPGSLAEGLDSGRVAGERTLSILYDPQTSGGLLVALPADAAERYVDAMRAVGHGAASVIGRVVEKRHGAGESRVRVTNVNLVNLHGPKKAILPRSEELLEDGFPDLDLSFSRGSLVEELTVQEGRTTMPEPGKSRAAQSVEMSCCDHPPSNAGPEKRAESGAVVDSKGAGSGAGRGSGFDESLAPFLEFMKAVSAPGRLDGRTKKLMAVALSIAHKCEPCLRSHLKSASAVGISREEIDEAAALAIAFGGCTAMAFYRDIRDRTLGR